jgi:hypothetical protein
MPLLYFWFRVTFSYNLQFFYPLRCIFHILHTISPIFMLIKWWYYQNINVIFSNLGKYINKLIFYSKISVKNESQETDIYVIEIAYQMPYTSFNVGNHFKYKAHVHGTLGAAFCFELMGYIWWYEAWFFSENRWGNGHHNIFLKI